MLGNVALIDRRISEVIREVLGLNGRVANICLVPHVSSDLTNRVQTQRILSLSECVKHFTPAENEVQHYNIQIICYLACEIYLQYEV